jgi:hypothetical protein
MGSEIGSYHRTQKGPWALMCYALAAVFFIPGWTVPITALRIVFFATGVLLLLLGGSVRQLTVADEGDHLAIRFGPFPLFRKRIFYDDIREVEKGRTTLLDGWGIQWSPWGGWVWNISGYACVVIRLKRGTLKVGTDDPDGLAEFLKERISLMR